MKRVSFFDCLRDKVVLDDGGDEGKKVEPGNNIEESIEFVDPKSDHVEFTSISKSDTQILRHAIKPCLLLLLLLILPIGGHEDRIKSWLIAVDFWVRSSLVLLGIKRGGGFNPEELLEFLPDVCNNLDDKVSLRVGLEEEVVNICNHKQCEEIHDHV